MSNSADKEVRLRIPSQEAKQKLEAQITEGEGILNLSISNDDEYKLADEAYFQWYDYTKDLLLKLFNTNKIQQEFVGSVFSFTMYPTFEEKVRELRQLLNRRLNTLRSVVRRVELFEEPKVERVTPSQIGEGASKKAVFVAYGRSEKLRKSMFDFLRAIGLNPLEWSQAIAATKKPSPYIGEILNVAFGKATAVVVLLSGDDEAKLRNEFLREDDQKYEKKLMPQARPNVLFEAGMAIGRSQDRTILVQVGELRPWSDIAGRHITLLDNTPQKRHELAMKLQAAGCEVDISGQDWMTAGDFGQTSPSVIKGIPGAGQQNKTALTAYCLKCHAKREIKEPNLVITRGGHTAIKGICSTCGARVFRII